MLYMKGTPAQPQCGFSKQVVSILHAQGEGKRTISSASYFLSAPSYSTA